MPNIAIIDGGTSYHHRALHGGRYRRFFSEIIYVRDLAATPLDRFDAVIVPDRTHPGILRAAKPQIATYLAQGGTIAALGETQSHTWLPGVTWDHRPTNFWWWKNPGETLGLYPAAPDHSLFDHLELAHATWHYHGVFTVPAGARSLIGVENDGSVLYEDTATTAGRMIISSLDPFYHYGSYFMPITEKFLDGFLEWMNKSCR
jgi:hypothetical protein